MRHLRDAGDGCLGCLGYVKGTGKAAKCLVCPDLKKVSSTNLPVYSDEGGAAITPDMFYTRNLYGWQSRMTRDHPCLDLLVRNDSRTVRCVRLHGQR